MSAIVTERGEPRSGGVRGDSLEPNSRQDPERKKSCENHELRDQEGRLRAGRSQLMQRRYLLEQLSYQDKNVEIKRQSGADRVDAAPCAGQVKSVARRDGNS